MQHFHEHNHDILREKFWQEFVHVIGLCDTREDIYIGLSGGSSLDIFYACFRERFQSIPAGIRTKIRFALLDERVVLVTHPDSNEGQLRDKFLTVLLEEGLLEEHQILGIDIMHGDIAGAYTHLVPRIDIALFGVGPDGHIASLFPHHQLLDSREKNYLEITDSPKPPAHRITISPEMIRDIPYVFVAIMRGKEEVLHRFQNLEISLEACPVKILRDSENLVVMCDIDE